MTKDLKELGKEYHRRCEQYDRRICTGGVYPRTGTVMPKGSWELGEINRNAMMVLRQAIYAGTALGYDRQAVMRAIRETAS